MSAVQLSENTLRLVRHIFTAENYAAVIAALETRCGSGLPPWVSTTPEGLERIRAKAGDITSVRRLAGKAQ